VVFTFRDKPEIGGMMIWLGALFDFFDGLAARLLKAASPIGKDLDSLADLITFCFLPGSIIYVLIDQNSSSLLLPFIGYLLVIFGAYRLAKFNNDIRQGDAFYGLPVPSSAIFVSALPIIAVQDPASLHNFILHPLLLSGISALLSAMMVSNFKLMSLKFANLHWRPNRHRYLLVLIGLVLFLLFKVVALPIIIITYVVFSIALNFSK
jgi:CDP-diacylglycerol--serine O-phosphatidyltransferase